MTKIIVDCFGGDRSPLAPIDGALSALSRFDDLSVVLSGDETIIKSNLEGKSYPANRVEILHAPQVIEVSDKPTDAIRLKRDSSMMKGIIALRDDPTVDGIVSTGSTGALVTGALVRLGRLKGVIRPAFCPLLPTMKGGIVGVCDSGANVEVKADELRQFAIMASLYLENVYGVHRPRTALLNVGVEEEKGDTVHKEAYQLLKGTPEVNFVGNMESRDLMSGNYDLVVADGFSGNVLVKTTEGTALELLKKLKTDIYSRSLYKMGALLMKGMFKQEKQFMNYQNYGGSVLLGTSKVVVKGHGSSKASAVDKCIEQAYKYRRCSIGEQIEEQLSRYEHLED